MPEWIDILQESYVENCARRAWLTDEIPAAHARFDRALAHVESVEEWTNVEAQREKKIDALADELNLLTKGAQHLKAQMAVAS